MSDTDFRGKKLFQIPNLYEEKLMAAVALKCPFCGSEDVRPYGTSNGKSGMPVIISSCSHKTFYAEYNYKGCKPDVKKDIIKWAANGAGIRATARELIEMDEMWSFYHDKGRQIWLWRAIEHESGEAIALLYYSAKTGSRAASRPGSISTGAVSPAP